MTAGTWASIILENNVRDTFQIMNANRSTVLTELMVCVLSRHEQCSYKVVSEKGVYIDLKNDRTKCEELYYKIFMALFRPISSSLLWT